MRGRALALAALVVVACGHSTGGGGAISITGGRVSTGACRLVGIGAFSGWNPVAITVIFTESPSDSFKITPKLI